MGFIYKISNDINSKLYIGKTQNTIEERFKEHCKDYLKRKNENRPLYAAMRKYGINHFFIEQIDECSNQELSNREKYWINYYDSYNNGYNATIGGDGKSWLNDELILSLWNDGKNIYEIHEITNYDTSSISNHLKDNNISSEQIQQRALKKKVRPVAMLDKNTEEILKTFNSVAEARIYTGNPHISEVCLGHRKTAAGYKWKYI